AGRAAGDPAAGAHERYEGGRVRPCAQPLACFSVMQDIACFLKKQAMGCTSGRLTTCGKNFRSSQGVSHEALDLRLSVLAAVRTPGPRRPGFTAGDIRPRSPRAGGLDDGRAFDEGTARS